MSRTYFKNENWENRLKKFGGGSWTINLDRVNMNEWDKFVYATSSDRYEITREKAQEVGFIKTLGGEQKLVVPIKYWEVQNAESIRTGEQRNKND